MRICGPAFAFDGGADVVAAAAAAAADGAAKHYAAAAAHTPQRACRRRQAQVPHSYLEGAGAAAGAAEAAVAAVTFSKVSLIVTLYLKYTWELTFENVCLGRQRTLITSYV